MLLLLQKQKNRNNPEAIPDSLAIALFTPHSSPRHDKLLPLSLFPVPCLLFTVHC